MVPDVQAASNLAAAARLLPLVALLMLALLLAPTAQAEGVENGSQTGAETAEAPGAPEQQPPAPESEPAPAPTEEVAPVEPVPPAEQAAPAEQVPPAEEVAPAEVKEETTPPVEETPPPVIEVTVPVVQEVLETVTPVIETVTTQAGGENTEAPKPPPAELEAPVKAPVVESSEGSPAHNGGESPAASGAHALSSATSEPEQLTTGAPLVVTGSVEPISPVIESAQAAAAATARRAAARRTHETICELSSVGAAVPSGCAAETPAGALTATGPLAAIVASVSAAASVAGSHVVGDDQAAREVSEYHPFIPPPVPGQGGGAEGSAAAGGGGASSVAGTHEPFVYLSVPHVLSRVRLRQRSWRTSFFVLIPERPG